MLQFTFTKADVYLHMDDFEWLRPIADANIPFHFAGDTVFDDKMLEEIKKLRIRRLCVGFLHLLDRITKDE